GLKSMHIKITPEQMKDIANHFTRASQEAQAQIRDLDNQINFLGENWAGNTQRKFREEFDNSKISMQEYIRIIEGIASELNRIANKFETVDNTY
ncbi:WXG100 family type VII secretion target, partial [Bacillus sp. JJ1127]